MSTLTLTFTTAGIAEVINAENTGTDPVEIAEVGVGTGQYTPSPSQTALQNEVKRLTTFSGQAIASDKLHVSIRDESSDVYQLYEFGLYLDSGTLLAVYSQSGTPILDKTASTILLLAVDTLITQFQATSLTFGDTDFMNPPATTTNLGVVELATDAETQTGTDSDRAVTPSGLSSRTSTTTRTGLVEKATTAEAKAGTADKFPDAAGVLEAIRQSGILSQVARDTDDWDEAVEGGLWKTDGAGTFTNSPDDSAAGWSGLVVALNTQNVIQIVWRAAENTVDIHSRVGRGATLSFTPWRRVFNADDIATQAEAQAGSINTKAMTPLRVKEAIQAIAATTTTRGSVELATNAEAQAGSDSQRALTPSAMASVTSTEVRRGLVELATQAEAETGSDNERAMTPLRVAQKIVKDTPQVARREYRTALLSATALEANETYHIASDDTFTLPDVTGLTPGATIAMTKSVYNNPVIQVEGGDGENIRIGKLYGDTVADTSITFDVNSEIILVWNGTSWEV